MPYSKILAKSCGVVAYMITDSATVLYLEPKGRVQFERRVYSSSAAHFGQRLRSLLKPSSIVWNFRCAMFECDIATIRRPSRMI